MNTTRNRIVLSLVLIVVASIAATAQWVAVARAVSGRIQQMQQKDANGQGGFDVATVVIEAPAQKVYETAVQRVQAHASAVKLLEQNPRQRIVAFTNGVQTASLQANPLGEKLTQLVVASTLDPAQPSATSLVIKSIQNVCAELKVECTLQTD
jgi:hypothetical protein